jgi:hypothetical protein
MITFYLVQSTLSQRHFTCSATSYEQAAKLLSGFGFRLAEWVVIHSCNSLLNHVIVCKDIDVSGTNILCSSHTSGRRNIF